MKKYILLILLFLCGCNHDWSYHGKNLSSKWGDISPKYKFCKIGFNQSPIDIDKSLHVNFLPNDIKFNYQLSEIEKVPQKYNLRINFHGKNFVMRGKKKYWLRALEFHHPSEHLIDSEPHSLEMQIYHKSEDEQWLVVSYFIELDLENLLQENLNFVPLIDFLNSSNIDAKIDPNNLIDKNNLSFFYDGSFTTPPCSEGVKWYIMKKPLYISKNQLNNIIKKTIFTKTNARDIQKYNPEKF